MIRLAFALALAVLPAAAARAQERVLSIGGAVTEVIYALGEEGRLVGRDTTSGFPPEAGALPDVGYMRQLSPEGVLSVAPDLIILSGGAGPAETLVTLEAAGVRMLTVPEDFTTDGVIARIEAVAGALGVPGKGADLAARTQAGLDAARAQVAQYDGERPRVLFLLSNAGGRLTGAGQGNAADAMITLAGGVNAVGGFEGYKALGDEAIAASAPDILLVMSRGDDGASEGVQDDDDYLTHPAIAQTPAGQAGRIIRMPGMFLLGFGPRTPEAIAELHAAFRRQMSPQ